jgi:hypothetical protein
MRRRNSVESLSFIDVNELNRLGAFAHPMVFPFMGLRTSRNLIEYQGPKWSSGRPPQQIPIQWTRCTYGGARPWFTCLCGKRVGKRLANYDRPGINAIPPRPAGMQRRTYFRLNTKLQITESKLIEGGIYRPRARKRRMDYSRRA